MDSDCYGCSLQLRRARGVCVTHNAQVKGQECEALLSHLNRWLGQSDIVITLYGESGYSSSVSFHIALKHLLMEGYASPSRSRAIALSLLSACISASNTLK